MKADQTAKKIDLKPGIQRILFDIHEQDLEESFTKGSGKGGSKINKTSSCVVLRHKPSGVIVHC